MSPSVTPTDMPASKKQATSASGKLARGRQPKADLPSKRRLVIVSNREPYAVKIQKKTLRLEKTPGGLVSALEPVMRANRGLWICWEGTQGTIEAHSESQALEKALATHKEALPYDIATVGLTKKEINHYYYGYANEQLWPLFHYFVVRCNFSDSDDWKAYQSANRKFANCVVANTKDDDLIWVQDYHMCLVPGFVRKRAPKRNIGYFCHIPFPHFEIFRLLPNRRDIIRGMLGADLIGFHTPDYVGHFLGVVKQLLPEDEARVDYERHEVILSDGRRVRVDAFPISIDFDHIADLAAQDKIKDKAKELREAFDVPHIGIGIDRLDYTKGVPERLEGLRRFFERYPKYKGKVVFVQIAAPTRTEVPSYQELKEEVERKVGDINGQLAEGSWTPIQFFYRSFPLTELLPYTLAANFSLLTPLRDGMNLVAKEYCAAKCHTGDGALILSELTGASYELGTGAVMVNPMNPDEVAEAIRQVIEMPDKTRREAMARMTDSVRTHDVHAWVRDYIGAFEQAVTDRRRKYNA